jgi:hypothetical protein
MKRIVSLLALPLLLLSTASVAAPPPWAGGHNKAPPHPHRHRGERPVVIIHEPRYRYVYYPQREFYYAPDRGLWFWIDGDRWQAGKRLPRYYERYRSGPAYTVVLVEERPYRRHHEVRRLYRR